MTDHVSMSLKSLNSWVPVRACKGGGLGVGKAGERRQGASDHCTSRTSVNWACVH